MDKWEYAVKKHSISGFRDYRGYTDVYEIQAVLDKMGEEGWELVSKDKEDGYIEFIYKRKVVADAEE